MKRKWIIRDCDIPKDRVIHSYFYEKTDLLKQVEKFKSKNLPSYLKLSLNLNHESLTKSVLDAVEKYGLYPFSYNGQTTEDGVYMSASLTWNQNALDRVSDDPHRATLGSSYHQFGSASLYEGNYAGRDTYKDSLSFKSLTALSQHGEIKKLTNSFNRTLVRSRISVLMGNKTEATKFNFGWHNDELIFVNMRVNIPVISNENFFIQIIQKESADQLEIVEFNLESGSAYVYDTGKNHRPYTKKINNQNRINMIYGVSPWFDYISEEKIWVSNEFYGEVHPFEMLEMGLVSSLIK